MKHGNGKITYAKTGNSYEGPWVKNVQQGTGKFTDARKQIVKMQEYRDGK